MAKRGLTIMAAVMTVALLAGCQGKGTTEESTLPQGLAPEAAKLYKSASAGNAEAAITLAHNYLSGQGVAADTSEAVNWLQQAANLGSGDAMLELGDLLSSNEPEAAILWYGRAAEQGNKEAAARIAKCFELGHGVKQNDSMAAVWRKRFEENLKND